MNILLDAVQAGNQSGTGTYVEQLIWYLPDVAKEARFYILIPQDQAEEYDGFENARFIPVDKESRIKAAAQRHLNLGKIVDRYEIDLIHFPANFSPLLRPRTKNPLKIITTLHDVTFLREPNWFPDKRSAFYKKACSRTIQVSDAIVTDSEASRQDIHTYLGIPESDLRVIYPGVGDFFEPKTPPEIQQVRSEYRLPPEYFLYVGTIEPRKNLPRLVEAWDKIAAASNTDLVIAGREGWKTEEFEEACTKVRLPGKLHRIGYVPTDDLPALISGAKAFVWPSLWEGFGLPPLEAMACGTPVLTSNTSSMPEVAGDAAMLVDPHDVRAISQGMLKILREKPLRERLRKAGRKRSKELTCWKLAEETWDAYQHLVYDR